MSALRPYMVLGGPVPGAVLADGFTWAGFLLGPVWLAGHRLWLALAVWLGAMAAASVAAAAVGADDTVFAVLWLTGAAVIGWQGQDWRLARATAAGVPARMVLARSGDEAAAIALEGRQ